MTFSDLQAILIFYLTDLSLALTSASFPAHEYSYSTFLTLNVFRNICISYTTWGSKVDQLRNMEYFCPDDNVGFKESLDSLKA